MPLAGHPLSIQTTQGPPRQEEHNPMPAHTVAIHPVSGKEHIDGGPQNRKVAVYLSHDSRSGMYAYELTM